MQPDTADTKEWLRNSGWSETRQVDTTEAVRHLEKSGYRVFPVVTGFLREFGGLQFPAVSAFEEVDRYRLKVDPVELTRYHPRRLFAVFEEALGRPICPIALALNGSAAIVMDEAGRSYMTDESVLLHIADCSFEALRIVCTTNLSELSTVLELG